MEKIIQPKGNLEIWKVYDDGTEELHFEEHNVIVSGMGVGLSFLFAGSGSVNMRDFQILNFQVGSAGDVNDYGVSTYKLNTPFLHPEYLTAGSEMLLENLYTIHNDVVSTSSTLVRLPYSNIQKVTDTSVRFNLPIDKNSLTGETISEVGLFMRNPRGKALPNPILVAYRPFTSLTKLSTFALLLKWTISF
tara:strand:+ start:561 stop:1133 length:573 start_codon:yes stop_codon:yes gene_type:complete